MRLFEMPCVLAGALTVAGLVGCASSDHSETAMAAAESPTCVRGLNPPGPPPGGFGPACAYQVARGFKDGSDGYFIVTVLFEYANGVLINVEDFERFVPDGKFSPRPEPEQSAGS